jgi:Fe-S cluster assembly ATP-binding protein
MSTKEPLLIVENLHASVDNREILKGVNLQVSRGEIHAVMGPNGSGKSTLSNVLMGHPRYTVTKGRVLYKGEDLLSLKPEERAKKGIFLAFQYPTAVPGVNFVNFLRTMMKNVRGSDVPVKEFRKLLQEKMELLEIDPSFTQRYLNDGFSGGEKKRSEILQMALLNPEMAILDETDSGLDIDALRIVCNGINKLFNPNMGLLIITHYQRMLNYIQPHVVHVLVDGQIVRSGGPELALELEKSGYESLRAADEQKVLTN